MPQRNKAVLILLLLSLTVSSSYAIASGNLESDNELKEEPLLTETLTVIQLDLSATMGEYRVTSIQKAAVLIAQPTHVACLKSSQKNRQSVEVVFTAYSLRVQQCHLLANFDRNEMTKSE